MPVTKHLVLLKFKTHISEEDIRRTSDELRGLQLLIPGILDFNWGLNSSPEGLDHGYTHGFIMTLKDAAARNAYLIHPEHERVKNAALPLIDDIVVFDFE